MSSKDQPDYFFRYFELRARGEPVRWILKLTGAKYREERIAFEDWPNLKPDFEWGKMPVLEVNGVQLHQTLAICRYLAKNHNMAPSDNWEQTRLEEITESVHELTDNLGKLYGARRNEKLDELPELIEKAKTSITGVMQRIEKVMSNEGWIISRRMTWCDIFVACYLDQYEYHFPDILSDKTPKLRRMLREVRMHPAIHSWINSRPPPAPLELKM